MPVRNILSSWCSSPAGGRSDRGRLRRDSCGRARLCRRMVYRRRRADESRGSSELVKRIVVADTATEKSVIQNMGASALVNGTRHGYGKTTPKDRSRRM